MNITWSILQLDRNLTDGGVYTAHWSVSAVDGDYSAYSYGTVGFTPDPSSPTFKPYNELTQDEVLNWVWSKDVDRFDTESSLVNQIDLKKNPVTATGLPWVNPQP